METTRKILSFHKEDRSSDPNNPQSILLDFISSCQNLRIWSLNSSTREYLNSEQLQKGKQIDEWWKQVTKGIYAVFPINKYYLIMSDTGIPVTKSVFFFRRSYDGLYEFG